MTYDTGFIATITIIGAVAASTTAFTVGVMNNKREKLKEYLSLKTPIYNKAIQLISKIDSSSRKLLESTMEPEDEVELASYNRQQKRYYQHQRSQRNKKRDNEGANAVHEIQKAQIDALALYLELEAVGSRKVANEFLKVNALITDFATYYLGDPSYSLGRDGLVWRKKFQDQQIVIAQAIREDLEVDKSYIRVSFSKKTLLSRGKLYKEQNLSNYKKNFSYEDFNEYIQKLNLPYCLTTIQKNKLLNGELIPVNNDHAPLSSGEEQAEFKGNPQFLSLIFIDYGHPRLVISGGIKE